jgi:hypothetical protein
MVEQALVIRTGLRIASTIAALASIVPGAGCSHAQAPWVLTLPSGERVTITREERHSFDNVSHVHKTILAVDYMTDHPINDETSVRMEARRVFAAYKTHVIGTDFNTVSLAALATSAIAGSLEGRPYYFERQADGRWVMLK